MNCINLLGSLGVGCLVFLAFYVKFEGKVVRRRWFRFEGLYLECRFWVSVNRIKCRCGVSFSCLREMVVEVIFR